MSSSVLHQDVDHQRRRQLMVRNQLQQRGITHQPTLDAMSKVPRHEYVPQQYRQLAYADRPLPVGFGQTISQPFIVAYMTQVIEPDPGDKVLEIGTGSGYQAAVLAEIVDHVYSIEIIPGLARRAQQILSEQYSNITLKQGDGYQGWEEHAPYDAIIVTAAPEEIPPALIAQLKEGGKMVIPKGAAGAIQELILIEKNNGRINQRRLMPVRFVPFLRDQQ
ncbi:MAG: protein-L-isoaspartate(D-aspartate) O-methyltransferase [Bacteroidales bacterium]